MIQHIIKKTIDIVWSACTSITQEVVVGAIGAAVVLVILYKIYQSFFVKNKNTGPCGCSSCGCSSSEKEKKTVYNLDLKK